MEKSDTPLDSTTTEVSSTATPAEDPLSSSTDVAAAASNPRDSEDGTDFLLPPFSAEMTYDQPQFPQNFDAGHTTSPNYPGFSGVDDSYDCDKRDPNSKKGVCGLRNIGNTCFMNTGLQCLMSISHLCKFILEHDEFHEATLAKNFSDLMKKIWSGEFSVLKPSTFKNALSDMHSQFRGFRQHDGQEFLALLLDTLHEELNQANLLHKSISPVEDVSEESCDSQNASEASTSKLSELEGLDIDSGKEESSCSNNLVSTDQSKAVLQKHDNADKVPSIEEFYMKDVKTLNTNVLTEEESSPVTTDSEKFPKSLGRRGRRTEYQPQVEHVKEGNNRIKTREKRTNVLADMKSHKELSLSHDIPQGSKLQLDTNSCLDMEKSKRMKMDDCGNPEFLKDFAKYNLPDSSSEYSVYTVMNTTQKNFDQITSEKLCSKLMFSEAVKCDMTKQSNCDDEQAKLNTSKEKLVNCLHNVDVVMGNCPDENLPIEKVALKLERKYVDEAGVDMVTSSSDNVHAAEFTGSCQVQEVSAGDGMASQSFLPNNRNMWKHDTDVNQKSRDIEVMSESSSSSIQLGAEAEANREWAKYLKHNQSVITETFQGQFKSTVVCNVCNHVSVTYEPFMYLSVPLPRAMEKQLVITFIPMEKYPPTRFLVTLNKHDLVSNLRQIVCAAFLKEDSMDASEILLAEVLDSHISRFLDDAIQICYINDSCRLLYAIETDSRQSVEQRYLMDGSVDVPSTTESASGITEGGDEDKVYLSLTTVDLLPMQNDVGSLQDADVIRSVDDVISCDEVSSSNNLLCENGSGDQKNSDQEMTLFSISDPSKNYDEFGMSTWESSSSGHHLNNELSDKIGDVTNTFPDVIHNPALKPETLDNVNSLGDGSNQIEGTDSSVLTSTGAKCSSSAAAPVSVDWKTCVICLDEFPENELLLHVVCKGILCHTCRERVTAHCGFEAMKCPVCSKEIDPIVDYIPAVNSSQRVIVNKRILLLPVHFQLIFEEESVQKACLFGHPRAIYIPNEIEGRVLYRCIQDMLLVDANFKLVLSDGQGYQCSRCSYEVHCRGCEVPCEGVVMLQSSDSLMVVFDNLLPEQIEISSSCHEDPMLQELQHDDEITLKQCFEAFSKSEYLDEHNPWFCPCCRKPQCASKTLSICRYPDVLIVYLKRFVFHNFMSTKLDNKVLFPLEGLDVSPYLCPAISAEKTQLLYDLQACVCHFGGVNAGHYISYVKNPLTKDWYHCNDETVVEQTPTQNDAASIYILFYSRKDSNVNFQFPTSLTEIIDTNTSQPSASEDVCKASDASDHHDKTTMNIDENMSMLYNSDLENLLKVLQDGKKREEEDDAMREDFYQ
ncbi:uncharacterized protein LOC117104308 [Anneissia japonica]|uniref:uncharacterized protein LOC117104308 n=1 Tax=Anneissia japonica TaxID=1529436 RepID=UPI0014259A19|nr:uncharacterized protein LOC117104308 [Anneissia japonica]